MLEDSGSTFVLHRKRREQCPAALCAPIYANGLVEAGGGAPYAGAAP
jgi:hypothetical protein